MTYNFRFDLVLAHLDRLALGALNTVLLSASAMAIGLILASMLAIGKLLGPRPIRFAINAYIEFIRNTPFLIQIFFIFFALPAIGLRLSPMTAALIALVVNAAAYSTEIIRAGIESIGKGQIEAGIALGLKRHQVFRFIVMKPALRTVYPALTSQFIFLMLSSSIVSVVSANELTAAGNDIQSETFASFEAYILVTVAYLLLALAFSALFAVVERAFLSYPVAR